MECALEFEVRDEAATAAFARCLGELADVGSVIALHGPLGVGKTRFAQGLALALGVRDPVCSPTFTLANEHAGRRGARFLHLDLYRLEDEDAVAAFGFEELLEGAALAAVEWPERAGTLLPERTIHVWMAETAAPEARRLRVTFSGGGLPETEWSRLAGIAGVQRI